MTPLLNIGMPSNTKILFQILSFANADLFILQFLYQNSIEKLIPTKD